MLEGAPKLKCLTISFPATKPTQNLFMLFTERNKTLSVLANEILSQPRGTKVGSFLSRKGKRLSKTHSQTPRTLALKESLGNFCLPPHPQRKKTKLREENDCGHTAGSCRTRAGKEGREEGRQDGSKSSLWPLVTAAHCTVLSCKTLNDEIAETFFSNEQKTKRLKIFLNCYPLEGKKVSPTV